MTTTFLIENGDVFISDATGQASLVEDRPKLSQDLQEMFTTAQSDDDIGAGLEQLLGVPSTSFSLRLEVADLISAALARLRSLQRRYHWSQRPITERVVGLTQLIVRALDQSQTDYSFKADVSTQSGGLVTAQTTLSEVSTT